MKLINESPAVSTNVVREERGRSVVVPDKLVSGLNSEEDVFLRTYIEARVLKVRDIKSLLRRSFFAKPCKMR